VRRFKQKRYWIPTAIIVFVIVVGALSGGSSKKTTSTNAISAAGTSKADSSSDSASPKPQGDPDVDKNTRAYVREVKGCAAAVVITGQMKGLSDLEAAQAITKAKDICDNVRGVLPGMDTNHFNDQASEAWAGVDKIKSGLNALLVYLDTGGPSKLAEAQDKIQTGSTWIKQGLHGINVRRKVYGLASLQS
jgi:hypothetical protein